MHRLPYLASASALATSFATLLLGGWWTWIVPFCTFIGLPVAEVLWRTSPPPPEHSPDDPWFDGVLYGVAAMHFALLGTWMVLLAQGAFGPVGLVGSILTVGIACGCYGINIAHELGHRSSPTHQRAAKVLLASALYMHFFIEHNRGHHTRVATIDDPASARRDETVYQFWLRSIPGGWTSAWQLEHERLRRRGLAPWSRDDEMLRFTLIQAALLLAVGALVGPLAAVAWMTAAVVGWLLLETVNYIEHYGLQREVRDNGHYERVRPHHSWNSDCPLSRAFLFELSHHSDHHARPTRPYQMLQHISDAPELPVGYGALIVLAPIPPLFRRVMHPSLDAWEAAHRT